MKGSLILAFFIASSSLAAPPRYSTFASYSEWAFGTASGVEIWSPGGITRAGRLDSLTVGDEHYVWDLAPTKDGGLLLGTGGNGRVYRFDGKELHLLLDSPQSDILSVLEDGEGNVWAGSSPDGMIYRIGPKGTPVEKFSTGQNAVWCLARSGADIVAGTGPEGRIFSCRPGKTIREVAKTSLTHVLSVLPMSDDEILVCGDTPCAIQRITPDGVVFTVARLDYDEARSLTKLGPDSIGVLAVGASSTGHSGSVMLTGSLAGPFSELWECPDSLALDMVSGPDGLTVAGGWPGRAYTVADDITYQRLVEVARDQVLSCTALGSRLYLGAGSPAALYWLDERRVESGFWCSPVVDGGTVSQWGTVAWMGRGGGLTLRGRTGNLGDPDTGWSEWVVGKASGECWELAMPDARFAQFEVTLKTGDGRQAPLEWLQVNYQPRNRDPVIVSFDLLPPGKKPPGVMGGSPGTGRTSDRPGGREGDYDRYAFWNASDPDDDDLEYSVSFCSYPTGQWIGLGEGVRESHVMVPQGTLAEGWYRFRLVVSDRRGNPPQRARTASASIGPVLVDDTPPILMEASWKSDGVTHTLQVDTQDGASGVAQASVSVDGQRWVVMEPADGVADSPREVFHARLPGPEGSVSVRLVDREGNSSTVSVPTPR
ncbi:hypothetical protein JXA88_11030 [Candidatus Fermentibacteria bacterium]|nr:hypothetical protein [Candidatus Fermentibacteria bacterium]